MKVGDLVRLTDIGCYHPDDDFTHYGVLLKIQKNYYNTEGGRINRGDGCRIRWSNNTWSVEPIQFIEKV